MYIIKHNGMLITVLKFFLANFYKKKFYFFTA